MIMHTIQIFEHQKLPLGGHFKEKHRKALLKLNELHSFHYLEATANGVAFKNYVGIVQIDDLIIEILPKIDNQDADKDKWRNILLDMLKVTRKLKAYNTDYASVKRRNSNLLEVYLDMFLREIDGLQKRGLNKQYRLRTSNTLALKGKLELAGHISKNLVHKERFYTAHQVYDHQHLIHQVLRKAIEIVLSLTRNSYLSAQAGRVDMSFPEVNSTGVTIQSFKKIHLSRKTRHYEKALELAHIIIANYSPSIRSGDSRMLALLFNMNSLWEQYVFEMLRRGQEEGKYTVSKPSKSLFTTDRYSLQPDMFVEFDDGSKIIIDTKWKVPSKQKASMADLRQIYTYNHYWNASHGVLLYPGEKSDSKWMQYADGADSLYCKISFLNVLDEEGGLRKSLNIAKMLRKGIPNDFSARVEDYDGQSIINS